MVRNVFTVHDLLRSVATNMLRLYKAYILPHFYYCSVVCHFRGKFNTGKIEALNKRIHGFILKDNDFNYSQLLEKNGHIL